MTKTIRAFLEDDGALASMEFVLWVPVFFFVLVIVTDASILFLTHTEMWNAARDTARRVSVGAMTAAEAPARATRKLKLANRQYRVAVSDANPVIVEISVGVADASVFGFFTRVLGRRLVARVEMLKEAIPPPS